MATTDLKAAPVRAEYQGTMSPADIAAHEAASFVRTAPLPPAAAAALARLELAFAKSGQLSLIGGA